MKILSYFLFVFTVMACAQFTPSDFASRNLASINKGCVKYLKKFKKLNQDAAVELELPMTNSLMNIITTEDGKVSGLLGDIVPLDWFLIQYRDLIVEYEGPLNIPWSKLTNQTKLDLIRFKTEFKTTTLFEERTIKGLKIKDHIELNFPKDTVFLGSLYPKGKHLIDFSEIFGPVEYCCNNDMMKRVSMLELHFRTNLDAGQVSNDAWTFLELAGMKKNHQHVHVVGKLPKKKLKEKPKIYSVMLSDFFRRSNLMAELLDIYFYKNNIIRNGDEKVTYFNYLTRENLKGVTEYFTGVEKKPGDKFKMGWVGMRGSDKYDQPGLWGLEYRAISSRTKKEHARIILNNLQDKIINQHYGIDEKVYENWLKTVGNDSSIHDIPSLMAKTLYHRDLEKLVAEATPEIRKQLHSGNSWLSWSNTYDRIEKFAKSREQFKMLIFDWSKDPMFFNKPDMIKKIQSSQLKALKRVLKEINSSNSNKTKTMNEILSQFLKESGLMEEVFNSFGIPLSEINKVSLFLYQSKIKNFEITLV